MNTNTCKIPLDEQCKITRYCFENALDDRLMPKDLESFLFLNPRLDESDYEYLKLIVEYAKQGYDYITCLDLAHCQHTGELVVMDD